MMLLFVPKKYQRQVRKALSRLLYIPFKFSSTGSEVIFRDPLKDKAYNNIANCYYELGDQDKAVQYLLQAISINPNNEQSLQTLGDYYYNRNEMDIALKYLRKSAQLGNVVVQEWLDSENIDW